MKPALLSCLILLLQSQAPASAGAAPPPPAHCAKVTEAMLTCMTHLAAAAASGYASSPQPLLVDDCCAAFSAEIGGENASCLCQLMLESAVAGSPISASRLLFLASSCWKSANAPDASPFDQICRGRTYLLRLSFSALVFLSLVASLLLHSFLVILSSILILG